MTRPEPGDRPRRGWPATAGGLESAGLEWTHSSLNDNTVEGFRHASRAIFAVQYHPEASPGPHDAAYLFDCFRTMMDTGEPVSAGQMAASQTSFERRLMGA